MVLPFVSLIHVIVALVAVVPYTIFPVARDLIRIQLGYYAMDPHHAPTPWSQLIRTSQPFNLHNTYASPPLIYLQYSPISIWEAPPPPPPPPTRPTLTTSPSSLDNIAPTVPSPTESPTLAPEAPSFAPAFRTALRLAMQWLHSIETVKTVMHVVGFVRGGFVCLIWLWAVGSVFLPIVYGHVVPCAQRTALYVCYRLSLLVAAMGRRLIPQIVWDVVGYRAALRREGGVGL